MDTPEPSPPPAPDKTGPRLGWLGVIAGFLLGTMSVGITVNILSDNPTRAIRALAAVTGLAAVAGIAGWLRHYPGSTLQHTARIGLWVLAAIAVLLALVLAGWMLWLTVAAAALLTITVLFATTLHTAGRLLGGASTVGLGAVTVVFGVALLREGEVLAGVATVGGGVAVAVAGVALLRDGEVLRGVALVGVGVGVTVAGVAWLREGEVLAGVAFVGTGVAGAVYGVALLRDGDVLRGVAFVGAGVACAVLGVALLRGNAATRKALRTWWTRMTIDQRPGHRVPGPQRSATGQDEAAEHDQQHLPDVGPAGPTNAGPRPTISSDVRKD